MVTAESAALLVTLSQAGPIPLDVAITCKPGELLALVGPSGSGKTTVLRAIAGLYRPAAGRIVSGREVWFDAADGTMVAPQQRAAGLVFQDYALFPHLSALDNVKIAMGHVAEPERTAQAASLLARMHLDGLEARMPDRLSGGQRQRVALARALARDPKVLLLDEPFSAVDRMTRERLKEELSSLRGSLEIPVLLVTHDLEEAQALADRIAILHRGRTLQTGAPDDVRLRPAGPLVARLMGQTNIFEAEVAQEAMDGGNGRIRWGERVLHAAATGTYRKGEAVAWLVPADYVAVEQGNASGGEAKENTFLGTLAEVRRLGAVTALTVRVGTGPGEFVRAHMPTREVRSLALQAGSEVTVHLSADGLHLMPPER